jgi:hypothetical protein
MEAEINLLREIDCQDKKKAEIYALQDVFYD